MPEIERVNGHRPGGLSHLLHPTLKSADRPKADELAFDLEGVMDAVKPLMTEVPSDAFTASLLGTEREGNGILIDNDGLMLTIGYLVVEATSVTVMIEGGKPIPAEVIAYDYDTGFGLARAFTPIDSRPLEIGSSADVNVGDTVIVCAQGGLAQTINAQVVAKREFAGYWEYLLDEAIFTAPAHPNWGGTALIGADGKLVGVGSLYVEDAIPGETATAGNMFVPIDLLKPIFGDLLRQGRAKGPVRPWLGMFTTEAFGQLVVAGLAPGGPADSARIEVGDIVISANGQRVSGLADLFRKIWGVGSAGVEVPLTLLREGDTFDIVVRSGNRYEYLRLPHRQ